VGKVLPARTEVSVEENLALVLPQLRRILRVCVLLVQEAVELVEALPGRHSAVARGPKSPLSEETGTITRALENLRYCYVFGL
jgi:hypothetical protein